MRTITYGGACSLDMYLADRNDGVDWLMWGDDVGAITGAYWEKVDTLLMGRRTYEIAMQRGGGGEDPGGISTYVFSRTLESVAPGATLVSDGAVEIVRSLKESEGKDICLMGGGLLAQSLFDAGLIDEVGLNIHPILLGDGIPVFPATFAPQRLHLTQNQPLSNGCVYVHYHVER